MIVCGLRAGCTVKEIMSYGNIKKTTVYDVEKKVWKINQDEQGKFETITSPSRTTPLPKTGRGRRTGLTEVWVEEVWPPSSSDCDPFAYFAWGVSELWVFAKSRNKSKDLIQKIKEVMWYLARDILAKTCASFRSRIEAVFTADGVLLNILIANMCICKFLFTAIKSTDFQLCCAI